MGTVQTVLTFLRSLTLIGSVIGFALGVWALVVIQAIDGRGETALSTLQSRLGAEASAWSQYITAAAGGIAWTWIVVVTSSIMALTTILVILSNRYYWLRISPIIVVLVEFTSTTCGAVAFGSALNLALRLKAFTLSPLATLDSAALTFFASLNPLSMALTIASALTGAFLLIACTVSFIELLNRRAQARDTRAFEPTVSALGMSHGFHALHPQPRISRERIPTMYDPYRAFRKGPGVVHSAKHVAFADEGAWMSRKQNSSSSRWSVSTSSPRAVEQDIMRLLDVKRARRVVPVRPARPWSGMNDSEIVHAI